MAKQFVFLLCCITFSFFLQDTYAQAHENDQDTFFLAKKKGLLGRLGRSITASNAPDAPVKTVNPYLRYNGKIIRTVEIVPLGFNQNLNDTTEIRNNLAIRVARLFHKNTKTEVIRKNLFFKEGDKFLPLLVADNERFLRDQLYIQDAAIIVFNSIMSKDSVDIVVLTRDVFSIGGSININSIKKGRLELKEENIAGTGDKISAQTIFDKERTPVQGYGAGFIIRNIRKSFINLTAGFTTFNLAINTNHFEEQQFFALLEKPLVSRYTQWTGAASLSYNSTANAYRADTLYYSDFQYKYNNVDIWAGYNFGYRYKKYKDSEKRLRHLLAARSFYTRFDKVPDKYKNLYNYLYADINGALFSYSLYRQNFYRTNFIYGFGRNEDVPEGINASFTTGWTNKQNIRRVYYGLDFEASDFSRKGYFRSYKFRLGGYSGNKHFEDVDLLLSIDQFTRLRKLNTTWRNRNFVSVSYTRQLNPLLNVPLFLESIFGLPYFTNGSIAADSRTTIKLESVFYNRNKILGFRFAPFGFTDVCFLKPTNEPSGKTTGYSALGGGIRTRNENLVFGTIELKGYFFPRKIEGMASWRVELTTKLQFKFNSSFVKKPDFVIAN